MFLNLGSMEAALSVFFICCMSVLSPLSGVTDGELRGCPPSPNCVSSQSMQYNFIHKIDPITYTTSRQVAYERISKYFHESENIWISEEKEGEYIRVIFFTKVFRFPDRVEIYFPEDKQEAQIRSQSILGLWDIFANRRRVNQFRELLAKE
ncbi:DUF1499 domain-containing protein [Leptospira bandrabouensis]|nr:DUF1499 domain-containing protein [Leptospira bandrabouensis]MCG6152813.1 DUF1499 domain-containing protein [Leptospira bandrabouensis]MCW7458973.1 DUF1499 domain-containing protein [Leptospira bandrabouensis]MCW7478041.1 DUF1499 domain-containing protein [Leptospira bandrabouensis]MCW7485837.1 DUF1499 domain-containing protein [Leptospira bandrabouensis]